MADNKIVITASLDFTTSKTNIKNDLEKIADGLNAKKAFKVIVNADLGKTQTRVQSQLNTISKNLKLDVGNINVGNVNTRNIVSGLKNVQTQAQSVTASIGSVNKALTNMPTKFIDPFDAVLNKDGYLIADKTIAKVKSLYAELGKVSVKGIFNDKNENEALDKLIVKIKSLTGETRTLQFQLNEAGKKFYYVSGTFDDSGLQKFIDSAVKAKDKIKSLRTSLMSDLKAIRSSWQDENGGKSVKSDENVALLKQQYIKTAQTIRELRKADSTTMASMKANANAQIDKLNQMVSQYHNAEKVATQLRAKGFETVRIDTRNNIDKFINSINNSKVPIQAMQVEIDKLTTDFAELDSIQDQAGKSAGLTNILNTLDNAKTKFQSLKELFKGFGSADWFTINSEQINKISDLSTKVAIYKQYLTTTRDEWKTQGLYVGEIQTKMASLARSLPNIKKPEKFDKWVSEWNELNQQATNLKRNLDEQVSVQNRIYEIQAKITSLDPTKNADEIALLNSKLRAEEKELSNLQMQSNVYSKLVSFEEQERYITEQTVKSREQLETATAKSSDKSTQQRIANMEHYQKEIDNAIKRLNALNNNTTFRNNSASTDVQTQRQNIQNLITQYEALKTQLQSTMSPEGLRQLGSTLTTLKSQFDVLQGECTELQTSLRNTAALNKFGSNVEVLRNKIIALRDANGKSVKEFGHVYDSLLASTDKMKTSFSQGVIDNETLNVTNRQFRILEGNIKNANVAGNGLFKTLWESAKKFSSWMSLTYVISSLVRSIRNAVTSVKEIDSAMTSLKKVTDETSTTYNNFLDGASKRAKELHTTMTDLIEQTATWAKLGYGLEDAQNLSEISMIYSKVGEVDNKTAVSDLVTVMKSFNIEAENSIRIVDMLNQLGNTFATDAASLGEGMTKAASALNMGGNSLEQALALLTGGVEITQNAPEMANALKVITMRIQGMKGSLEELGEEYEDIESISKTQTHILNLTGGKVNIFDEQGNFRSTYDILKDVSDIIDKLSDTERADLTETLFGKMRGNQGMAIIQAFQSGQIEKAYNSAMNSAGSAQAEFDKWSESIEAHAETLKASAQSLSESFFDSAFIKDVIDGLNKMLNIFEKIVDTVGALPSIMGLVGTGLAIKNVGRTKMYVLFLNMPTVIWFPWIQGFRYYV